MTDANRGRSITATSADTREGGAEAFASWCQLRLRRSLRLAAAILRDESAAEDAVQDALLRAWVGWPRLRDRSQLDAWLDRIIVNSCRDSLRRANRASRSTRMLRFDDEVFEPSDRRIDELRQAITRLSPEHRVVVVLRYLDDLSVTEIAQRTGRREGTVKSRLHYALRALRAAYDAAERKE